MKLINKLNQFKPVQFEEYGAMDFERSSESKFILSAKKLIKVLDEIKSQYFILEIKEKRLFRHTNEYFDTVDFQLYLGHHNGNGTRYLIKNNQVEGIKRRSFKIKSESNKGEVSKLKHKSKPDEPWANIINELIQQNTPYKADSLKKIFKNQFYRFVLIHKNLGEKIVIDLDLELSTIDDKLKLPYLAIVELKQTKFSLNSDFVLSLRKHNVQKTSINKYCIGVALLNKDVKKNKFKSKLLAISKINEHEPYSHQPITA
jgi:hypothetical protein